MAIVTSKVEDELGGHLLHAALAWSMMSGLFWGAGAEEQEDAFYLLLRTAHIWLLA